MGKLYKKGGFETTITKENADYKSLGDAKNLAREKKKRKEREESSSEAPSDGEDDSQVPKKKRVIWTTEMHQKFLDAVAQIGQDSKF